MRNQIYDYEILVQDQERRIKELTGHNQVYSHSLVTPGFGDTYEERKNGRNKSVEVAGIRNETLTSFSNFRNTQTSFHDQPCNQHLQSL